MNASSSKLLPIKLAEQSLRGLLLLQLLLIPFCAAGQSEETLAALDTSRQYHIGGAQKVPKLQLGDTLLSPQLIKTSAFVVAGARLRAVSYKHVVVPMPENAGLVAMGSTITNAAVPHTLTRAFQRHRPGTIVNELVAGAYSVLLENNKHSTQKECSAGSQIHYQTNLKTRTSNIICFTLTY